MNFFEELKQVRAIAPGGLVSDIEDTQGLLTEFTLKRYVPDSKRLSLKASTKAFYDDRVVNGRIEEGECRFKVGRTFVSFYFYSNFKYLMESTKVTPDDVMSGKCLARIAKGKLELLGTAAPAPDDIIEKKGKRS